HAQESQDTAERKANAIIADLRAGKMSKAADIIEQTVQETLTYYAFPDIHWQKIRTNKPFRAHHARDPTADTGCKVAALVAMVRDETDDRLPPAARFALLAVVDLIGALADQIDRLERSIVTEAKRDEDMRRLTTIPGVGAITAATIKSLVPDPGGFRSGRHFAAWLGLAPRPHSSGGKDRLGRISKMGNPELRTLLVIGATSVLRIARNDARTRSWLTALLARRPFKVAAVALANKMARIIWALLNKGGIYRRPEPLAITAV